MVIKFENLCGRKVLIPYEIIIESGLIGEKEEEEDLEKSAGSGNKVLPEFISGEIVAVAIGKEDHPSVFVAVEFTPEFLAQEEINYKGMPIVEAGLEEIQLVKN